jgi:hypothetical protein
VAFWLLAGPVGRADTSCVARCGRPTKEDRTPCRRPVAKPGMACRDHRGFSYAASRTQQTATRRAASSSPPRPRSLPPPMPADFTRRSSASASSWQPADMSPAPPSRRAQERKRVQEAAEFCAGLLSDGWRGAVADQITDYAAATWQRLPRSRRKRACKALARVARSILQAKAQLHMAVGQIFGWAMAAAGADAEARAFTQELAANIPIVPIDAKMVAVARGVQVVGILLCLIDGRDITDCQCFVDLALTETKERVKAILIAATSDWPGLARFPHDAAA